MAQSLPSSDLLGFGFNILGTFSAKSCTERILAPLPASGDATFTYGNREYIRPPGLSIIVGTGSPSFASTTSVFESSRKVQDHFAAKAGVKGTYGGFSGQMDVLYDTESTTEVSCWYAMTETRIESFTMKLDRPRPSPEWLDDEDVKTMLGAGAFNPASPEAFFAVFRKFGTHVITGGTVGADVYYAASVTRSSVKTKQEVSTKLALEYEAVSTAATADAKVDWSRLGESWAQARTVRVVATGGDESKLLPVSQPAFGDHFAEAFHDWKASVNDNPKLIDFSMTPLSALFSGAVAVAVEQAIAAYVGNGIYVEAAITQQALSGAIEVSGKSIPQRPFGTKSGGAQLVIIDAEDLSPLLNRTVYGAENKATELWKALFNGVEDFERQEYFCALSVFNWHANMFPTGNPARWLRRCGATLESWEQMGGTGSLTYIAYAFIGKSNIPIGSGLERFDGSGGTSSFAAVTTALVPRHGGFAFPGSLSEVTTS